MIKVKVSAKDNCECHAVCMGMYDVQLVGLQCNCCDVSLVVEVVHNRVPSKSQQESE